MLFRSLQWENYSRTHDDWLIESFTIQDTWERYYGPKNLTFDADAAAQVNGNFGLLEANIRYAVTNSDSFEISRVVYKI